MALSILLHPPTALWRREALAASRGTFWVRMDGASSLRIYRPPSGWASGPPGGPLGKRFLVACNRIRVGRAADAGCHGSSCPWRAVQGIPRTHVGPPAGAADRPVPRATPGRFLVHALP